MTWSTIKRKLITRYGENIGPFLIHENELQLLIAIILSAQTTDKKVNDVTLELFKNYKTLDQFLKITQDEWLSYIRGVNYGPTKARNLHTAMRQICEIGGIPLLKDELVSISGVGIKTALVFLGQARNVLAGIPVDTHVLQFAIEFGLTNETDREKVRRDIEKKISKRDWIMAPKLMILYRREFRRGKKRLDNDPLCI